MEKVLVISEAIFLNLCQLGITDYAKEHDDISVY